MDFLNENNLLSNNQHGFRKHHSCQTQLLSTVDDWAKSLDKGKSTHAIFLDFAKAFDSVPHHRLLIKLENVGIRGKLLKWIEAFLTNRYQRVLLDGQASNYMGTSNIRCPQGSILGPLLFLLYVNDIGDNLKSPNKLFADDCIVYKEIKERPDCEVLQRDIQTLYRWTQDWHLNILEVTNKRKPIRFTYKLNDDSLDQVEAFKYLGVIIDKKLSWSEHVNHVKGKVLNLLRRSLHGCSKTAKARTYTALVRPHLETCSPVWSPHQKQLKQSLENVQKRASRWVCAKWDASHFKWTKTYEECCNELNWQIIKGSFQINSTKVCK